MESCIISKINECGCSYSSDLSAACPQRIATIINRSELYEDNLFQELEENLHSDYFVHTHKACVPTFTSEQHNTRRLKQKGCDAIGTYVSPRKTRHSSISKFYLQKHCLFYGGNMQS